MRAVLRASTTRLLDRPGGRLLLSRLATWHARRKAGPQARLFHDGSWVHCIDGVCVPERRGFEYYANSTDVWRQSLQLQLRHAQDYWFHVYQPQLGHTIVDIGAGGLGMDILAFSRGVGPLGRVLAVEAHPVGHELLTRFCRLNGLSNVTTLRAAIGDRPGPVQIEDLDESESNTIDGLEAMTRSAVKTFTVEGRTVDDLCASQSIAKIDFLKMNIEGAERLAVRGMSSAIDRVAHLCVACHDFRADRGEGEFFRTRHTVIEFLRDHHFEIVERTADPRDYVRDHVHAFRASERTRD
jgi:FkbM family methyltransferase